MKGKKPPVKLFTFLLQNSYFHLTSGILQFFNSRSVYLIKGINRSNDNLLYFLPDDQIGTGRSLTKVGTRLKGNINGRFR